MALLSVGAFGGTKNFGTEKKDITLSSAVQVGNEQLEPGDYTLRWNATGESTNVTFLRNGKETLTVPARFVSGSNQPNAAFETNTASGTPTLDRVFVKNGALDFTSAASSTNTSSAATDTSSASQ
jgi:hypothetical protein